MILGADFETTTIKHMEEEKGFRIYWWGLKNLDNSFCEVGTNLESFIKTVETLKESTTIFFHNGGKFDFRFFIDYLLKNYNLQSDSVKLRNYKSRDFNVKIKGNKAFLEIRILLKIIRGKRIWISFKDSLFFIPYSAGALGDILGLPKLEIDYLINPNWKDKEEMLSSELGQQINKYGLRDIDIILSYLEKFEDFTDITKTMTLSQTAYKIWASGFEADEGEDGWIDKKDTLPYITAMNFFSGTEGFAKWDYFKKYYRGGITTPIFKRNEMLKIENVSVYDINSMYPAVMRNKPMPFGYPIQGDFDDKMYPFQFIEVLILEDYECVGFFNIFPKNKVIWEGEEYKTLRQYQAHLTKGTTLYMCTPEWEYFEKNYKCRYIKKVKYSFKVRNDLFTDYIEKFKKLKIDSEKTGDMAMRTIAKLFMNSLYGKFGQKRVIEGRVIAKIPEEGIYGYQTPINEEYYFKAQVDETNYPKSIFLAIAITGYSHVQIAEAINANWENIIYVDTDSIHVKGEAKGIKIDDYNFGDWKWEGTFKWGVYRQPKQYFLFEDHKGKNKIACAGVATLETDEQIEKYGKFGWLKKHVLDKEMVFKEGCVKFIQHTSGIGLYRDEKNLKYIEREEY